MIAMHARESVRVCECLVCVCVRVNIAILNITAIKDWPQPEAGETPPPTPPTPANKQSIVVIGLSMSSIR